MDLYDPCDSKGQMSFSSSNQLPKRIPAISVAPSNEVWNIGNRIFAPILVQQHALTAIQQLQRYAIVFRNVLASNQHAMVKKACTSHSFVMRTPCGPGNCLLYFAVWWEGRLGHRMPSKDSDRTCNIKWLQQNLSSQGLYERRLKVWQWMLYTIPRSAPSIL